MHILCNVKTCRTPLTGALWVTSCSHAFCEEHASTLTHTNIKCPACNSVLGKRFDVIRQNSKPADEFKAMLLVGLRPEIVLDIAMSAISFWNYQVDQELKIKSVAAKQFKEMVEKAKDNHATVVRQLALAKKTSDDQERQMDDLRTTIKHLRDQIVYKESELRKVQALFNVINSKQNSLPADIQSIAASVADTNFPDMDLLHHNIFVGLKNRNNATKRPAEFVFEPHIAPKKND